MRVRLLATSQQPLQLNGEHLYRLDTLAVPPPGTRLDAARGYGALALLEQRAQAVDRRYLLTEATLEAAIELCRELDGIALAIEMAAARLPALGAPAVRAQLARLATPHRSAPARQQTLRATLEWSHALLPGASPLAQARLWNCIATWCGTADAPVPPIEAARERAAAWQRVGDAWQHYWALSRLGAILARSGDLAGAERCVDAMHAIEAPSWPLRRRFGAAWMGSLLALCRGDAAGLEASARVELAMAEQTGHERALSMARANLAKAALLAGDEALASRLLDRAHAAA